jgi:hypothetical protein
MATLTRDQILDLLHELNAELAARDVIGQLQLAGGAVMCLVFRARDATRDVDAIFEPSSIILDAALALAARHDLPDSWLNNAVKGYLSDRGSFDSFLELDHLRVFVADARYMLAMKTLAFRIGEGYRDEEDVRYLLRHLDVTRWTDAEAILAAYYPLEGYPPYALEAVREMIEGRRR